MKLELFKRAFNLKDKIGVRRDFDKEENTIRPARKDFHHSARWTRANLVRQEQYDGVR